MINKIRCIIFGLCFAFALQAHAAVCPISGPIYTCAGGLCSGQSPCPLFGDITTYQQCSEAGWNNPFAGSISFTGVSPEPGIESNKFIRLDWNSQWNGAFHSSLFQSCDDEWVAVVPRDAPPISCTVGNPVDPSSGAKIQQEIDVSSHGMNQVGFARNYSNTNKLVDGFWSGSHQKSLRIIDPKKTETIWEKSSPYADKATACTSGFSDLKTKISDSWTLGTSARYINNVCQIVRNNKVIRTIAILPNSNSIEVSLRPGAIQLVRENGSILNFGLGGNKQFVGVSGESGQLISVANAAPIAWRYKAPNGDVENYNASGKLLSITASNGMKQEFFYDATSGLLTRVKDSTNRELLFSYTGNQISSVTVDGNKTTSYTYNASGLITQVTRPDNTTRTYHYEDARFPSYLTGITDERGKRYATWTYDAQGRAISSEHAGGADKTLLSFNTDGSTTVTNALNKQTIYRFDDIAGARRVVKVEGQPTANCAGANQDYTYTNEGWLSSESINAAHSGGIVRSSDEFVVMTLERRDDVVQH
ncbi:MAG: hypothetical protein B0W54_18330 [Cellvibrio sp. 79]|nr:MAG: hypothetical protein B0W54_18330 [Cellvibrio sp. 79]